MLINFIASGFAANNADYLINIGDLV